MFFPLFHNKNPESFLSNFRGSCQKGARSFWIVLIVRMLYVAFEMATIAVFEGLLQRPAVVAVIYHLTGHSSVYADIFTRDESGFVGT